MNFHNIYCFIHVFDFTYSTIRYIYARVIISSTYFGDGVRICAVYLLIVSGSQMRVAYYMLVLNKHGCRIPDPVFEMDMKCYLLFMLNWSQYQLWLMFRYRFQYPVFAFSFIWIMVWRVGGCFESALSVTDRLADSFSRVRCRRRHPETNV